MTLELIIAGLALFITIIINIATIAFFAGILKANQQHQKEMIEQIRHEFKENFFRLEKKQDKHNSLIERQFITEGKLNVIEEKLDVANHRITDLEGLQQ